VLNSLRIEWALTMSSPMAIQRCERGVLEAGEALNEIARLYWNPRSVLIHVDASYERAWNP
jgi:hypothetical protein